MRRRSPAPAVPSRVFVSDHRDEWKRSRKGVWERCRRCVRTCRPSWMRTTAGGLQVRRGRAASAESTMTRIADAATCAQRRGRCTPLRTLLDVALVARRQSDQPKTYWSETS
ncbi:hypothetical protein EXIGLDRAFT_495950 [Exidia glandulosa HHB12029]|uniref:Uncharacterized protein n=1 Tax=Exidia glandulosa HHB12029 TaxID=1314781 RepID=A0A165JGW8_EXIGL|nr:hypothetical protein EXIGLDRAFT_495950 [Exidia glandulosa HHB12029]